ncbi:PfkB family carbohydrate kinase [Kitasatospora sp. NPDC001664]|uniref:PfkB family carbohydrate kinase n=1 Tax=Kitasatospora albolonga TaxID=68173 RepID=UPI0035E82C76
MPAKVVVVGSVNVDLAVRVPHLPRPGETVTGGGLEESAGGKGANQAVAAARLGVTTVLIARVGDDAFGRRAREGLAAAGVGVAAVTAAATATGTALIVIDPEGENTITVSPGANADLDSESVEAEAGRLAGAGAMLLQLEVPVATCLTAAGLAKAAGVPVVLNAAPLPGVIGAELSELIAMADVLVVNEVEAADLLGGGAGLDLLELPAALGRLGPAEVVVTLGARGAVHTGPDGGGAHVPAFAVAAVDAVGAGDAFCAALAVARAEGVAGLGEAVRRACAVGALATTRRGAQGALPTRAEVGAFLAGQGGAPS